VCISHFQVFQCFLTCSRSHSFCVSFSTFFSFLAIIQVLLCVFLILQVFQCFSPYSRSYHVIFSFSSFVSFVATVLQCPFLVVHVLVFSPYSRSYSVCFSFFTFFSFFFHSPSPRVCVCFSTFFCDLAIFQVLPCAFFIFHVFQCFWPYSRSYTVFVSHFSPF